MTYAVKELFKTLQGEGAQAGRTSVFCRFAGCNLWSGREQDRDNAVCTFCDTDFVGTDGPGGGKFKTAEQLAQRISDCWGESKHRRYVVFTGGEPLLQLDGALINAVHAHGFEIAVETNGTIPAPDGIDWICVSPKADSKIVQRKGDELKLVFPQTGVDPKRFVDFDFQHHFLQPLDGPDLAGNTIATTEYCLAHPQWRLSLQTHKLIGIP
ncbi:7-carboxy-7-deazaguanine synthase [Limoniibacter endophyticus]|uniref:7-carboxy-7-deazaguanine synthase n=1 Tax=Limoniibacter endophyticus TaxID=1565040 RepID=A0A8J3DJP1_9HYPH|nr:7-carboxy-7-deazaguanine synthase [Limoniibacter endophyticus]GHC79185.1 7-carboxy-7-deazaguanine synthase [Limoniibacter endophyticus]